MLGFCHLFAGAALGSLIYKETGQRGAVLACGIGALLPDLIDKPLGHWLLSDSLNAGRIYAHTLIFMLVVLMVGIYYWKKKLNVSVLAAGSGIGTHLFLDEIWFAPVTLFWPFLGPFSSSNIESYFTTFAEYEITSLSEWIFAFAFLYSIIMTYQDSKIFSKISSKIMKTRMLSQLLLFTVGLMYIAYAIYTNNHEYLVIGLTAASGSIILAYAFADMGNNTFARIISKPPDELQ